MNKRRVNNNKATFTANTTKASIGSDSAMDNKKSCQKEKNNTPFSSAADKKYPIADRFHAPISTASEKGRAPKDTPKITIKKHRTLLDCRCCSACLIAKIIPSKTPAGTCAGTRRG